MNSLIEARIDMKIRSDFDALVTIHEDSHTIIISKNCQE